MATEVTTAPKNLWRRFTRPQFSLRTLLILITVATFILWLDQPPAWTVSRWQAARIRVGMTEAEVMEIIGNVHDISMSASGASWTRHFEVQGMLLQPRRQLYVTFVEDRVISVKIVPHPAN